MYRRRLVSLASAWVVVAALIGACSDSDDQTGTPGTPGTPGTNNSSAVADAGSIDAANNADDSGNTDDADAGTTPVDNGGGQCSSNDLTGCPDRPNAQPIACVAFRCAYQCDEGFADNDDDLATPGGTGCESDCIRSNDAVEVCDGLDNDCNGVVDDGFDVGEPCSVGVGACEQTGTIGCLTDGTAACSAVAGEPDNEVCDGLDNDCDGQTDEGNPGSGGNCFTGDDGLCGLGTEQCEGGQIVCRPSFSAVAESCGPDLTGNGFDDDCDGDIDENCAACVENTQQSCYSGPASTRGVGRCADGRQECLNGSFGACNNQTLPAAEACNNADDDCDGQTDEDFANKGEACAVGLGVCKVSGTFECSAGGTSTFCATRRRPPSPQPELCDKLDNDCDGAVDEDFGLGAICSSGVGACRRSGRLICSADLRTSVCDAVPGTPSTEKCGNLIDDDCDGVIDEGCDCTTLGCPSGEECCFDSGTMMSECTKNPGPSQLCVK